MSTHIDNKNLNLEQVTLAADLLKLLSDPTRIKILWALLHGEHSVGELAEQIHAQPAAVSQHLAKLRIARVVKVRREGNKMFYQTDNNHVRSLIEQALSQADHIIQRNK